MTGLLKLMKKMDYTRPVISQRTDPPLTEKRTFHVLREADNSLAYDTIRKPDLMVAARRGKLKVVKRHPDRDLVVIYIRARHVDMIVTAYWREKC